MIASVLPASAAARTPVSACKPRLGFLGVGWIGRNRLEAIATAGAADIVGLADPSQDMLDQARMLAPFARTASSLEALLHMDLDGLIIATPSALHATQAEAALAAGVAVFSQKPLARSAAECSRVVAAARNADRLLGVDLSYRHTAAMRALRALVDSGELGEIYAVDLVFHNAYGPDKAWFRDIESSGGGCVMDLGIHMVDLALWTLGFPKVGEVTGRLFAQGKPLPARPVCVEDFALAQFTIGSGAVARLACSWNLAAGRDAVIEATFHGRRGGAAMRNVGGSFLDFTAERYDGTRTIALVQPPDAWGGRAAVDWVRRLAAGDGYDPAVERVVEVTAVLDAIYGR